MKVVCADERSAALYNAAVALVGEVWVGAKLEAVDKGDLPLRPRARVWLPSAPSSLSEVEDIFRYCNPDLPAHNWKAIRFENSDGDFRQALMLLNLESLKPLAERQGVIYYGFEKVVMKVYQTDSRGDDEPVPVALVGENMNVEDAPIGMEVESVMSDIDSIAGPPSSAG
ncbi:PREDICTED: uncharacterized protein LOC108356587 [Rhagoletis zephyria]|uniref:uncharacterized protein LOC108356587 n=1 Tax=Rhagoletis zephyria TaxID=28612 RepID=UPI000811875B|nr:PREDICTED: uncharacterized protein LOC108356587 [Rhagoletis zephyria]